MESFNTDQFIGEATAQPDFPKLSQTIESNIQKISQNVSSMQKMVNQLNSSQDSQVIRNQFQQIQNYTQQLARDTSSLLKTIMTMPLQSADQRQQKLTRERLGDEFLKALHLFQATQRKAAQKSNEDVRRNKPVKINIGDPFQLGMSGNNELIALENTQKQRQEQIDIPTDQEIRDYEERERRVVELEQNITSVNEIFKELGSMIHEQSEMVDSIEANVEHTTGYIESGTQQIRQAADSQSKARKKKLFLVCIGVIILTIVLIVIFAR